MPEGWTTHRNSDPLWRWGWDSNPRYACAYNGFRDRPVQPLRHPTADRLSRGFIQAGPGSANLFLRGRAAGRLRALLTVCPAAVC